MADPLQIAGKALLDGPYVSTGDTFTAEVTVRNLRGRALSGATVTAGLVEKGTGATEYKATDTTNEYGNVLVPLVSESAGIYEVIVLAQKDTRGGEAKIDEVKVEATAPFSIGTPEAPSIFGVSLSNDGSGNLAFSFDSDEQLGFSASDIAVSVDGPATQDVYTFDRTDFDEFGSGPFTYSLLTTQAYDDGTGTYTATVDVAKDAAGQDGATGQGDSYFLSSKDTDDGGSTDPVAGTPGELDFDLREKDHSISSALL